MMRVKFLEDAVIDGKEFYKGMQYDPESISENGLENLKAEGKVKLIVDVYVVENELDVATKEVSEITEEVVEEVKDTEDILETEEEIEKVTEEEGQEETEEVLETKVKKLSSKKQK